MIRLDTTLRKLQLSLGNNVTTSQLPILVSYSDKTTTDYVGATTPSNSSNTTSVDICAAPTLGAVRDIDLVSISNADTANATVNIIYNDNATLYTIFTVTLSPKDKLIYVHGNGWNVIDISGNTKTAGNTGPTGPLGNSGPMGPAVYLEAEGIDGDIGPPGPPGVQGTIGSVGPTGPQGNQGPLVLVDIPEQDEVMPLPGPPGPPGVQGVVGNTGSQGVQGPQGPATYLQAEDAEEQFIQPGPQGITGANGTTGAGGPASPGRFFEVVDWIDESVMFPPGNTQKIFSMVKLNTANGYGSTNTKIRRFLTTVLNQGGDITYADSATLGASFTINASGSYAMSYTDRFGAVAGMGFTLNSTQPTINIAATTIGNILANLDTSAINFTSTVSTTVYLVAGDVIRAHTDGVATGASAITLFTITRVG